MADESSAQIDAPNQVSVPAAIQTSSMPLKLGTARLTSDGWTKIDEPTMVPTTIAVACVRPIDRASDEGIDARLKPSRYGCRLCRARTKREGFSRANKRLNRITG